MDYGWNFLAKRIDRLGFGIGMRKADVLLTCSDFIREYAKTKYPEYTKDKIFTLAFFAKETNVRKYKPALMDNINGGVITSPAHPGATSWQTILADSAQASMPTVPGGMQPSPTLWRFSTGVRVGMG